MNSRCPKSGYGNRIKIISAFVFVVVFSFPWTAWSQPIIADHTSVEEFDQIPPQWIERAKELFRISYGHTSHGSQIVTGMGMVMSNIDSSLYRYYDDYSSTLPEGALSFWDGRLSGAGAYDLGNSSSTAWVGRTRDHLNSRGSSRNMIMWSWCGQVSSFSDQTIQNDYLANMLQLQSEYPNVTLIYMTGHLDGSGESGNLHRRNNLIRAHVRTHNAVLFDFADIESYDPDGTYYRDKRADDQCRYYDENNTRRNWATDWCSANNGQCPSCSSCAHSHCLNCYNKGKAFWWMMARLAGWPGVSSDTVAPSPPTGLQNN